MRGSILVSIGIIISAQGTRAQQSQTSPPPSPAISVVYFDLGNTLVKRGPDGPRRIWIEGAPEALTQLQGAGLRLGVLSNTGSLDWDQVLESILPQDFDVSLFESDLIIVSSAVGTEKPDPRIFEYAINRAAVPAENILFITETMDHVLAAQAAGMRALWVVEGVLPAMVEELMAALPPAGVNSE